LSAYKEAEEMNSRLIAKRSQLQKLIGRDNDETEFNDRLRNLYKDLQSKDQTIKHDPKDLKLFNVIWQKLGHKALNLKDRDTENKTYKSYTNGDLLRLLNNAHSDMSTESYKYMKGIQKSDKKDDKKKDIPVKEERKGANIHTLYEHSTSKT
jgi:hypothetical protein